MGGKQIQFLVLIILNSANPTLEGSERTWFHAWDLFVKRGRLRIPIALFRLLILNPIEIYNQKIMLWSACDRLCTQKFTSPLLWSKDYLHVFALLLIQLVFKTWFAFFLSLYHCFCFLKTLEMNFLLSRHFPVIFKVTIFICIYFSQQWFVFMLITLYCKSGLKRQLRVGNLHFHCAKS